MPQPMDRPAEEAADAMPTGPPAADPKKPTKKGRVRKLESNAKWRHAFAKSYRNFGRRPVRIDDEQDEPDFTPGARRVRPKMGKHTFATTFGNFKPKPVNIAAGLGETDPAPGFDADCFFDAAPADDFGGVVAHEM